MNLGQTIVEELLEELQQLDEGVYDPGIFKAVFMAGGPGSGKSFVSSEIFGVPHPFNFSVYGLRSINSDVAFEQFLKKAGYGTKLSALDDATFRKLTSNDPSSLRNQAKTTVEKMFQGYLNGRLGIIIDSTGAKYDKVQKQVKMLESLGYDCMMVFVNTSLEVALERNKMRDRILPDHLVKSEWENVQNNLGKFQSLFSNNFVIVDNNAKGVNIPKTATSAITKFVKSPVHNHVGKEWIQRELQLKNRTKVNEASEASKDAKKKGLTYAGGSAWVNKSGKTVAKTEDGKLVPVKGGDNKTTPTTSSSSSTSTKDKSAPKGGEEESKGKMTLVGVYSGRFQPFGRHHFAAYKQLQAVTGGNTYIATSDVTDSKKSPFTFADKKRIIQKYGVSGNRVVKTKSPYTPTEILKNYDPKTTALVVIFGEKDAGRLGGKYYVPFKNGDDLEGYMDKGYYIIAQHESVKVGGKELSGTQIRQFLGSHKIDDTQKQKLFKSIFGWYDPSLYKTITGKIGAITPKNESVLSSKSIIEEGGAYGHMAHPFDDQELTFGDMKEIAVLALQGHLDKEAKVMEKLDGQALSVSWVGGTLVAARNKSHLKNQGENALSVSAVKSMFAGRGALEKSFGQAMVDLQSAISKLSDKQKDLIFQNGKNFMALEVVYPETENVLPYGQSTLIFHGVISYDANGNPIGDNKSYARILAGMIRQVNADVQKTFKIQAPSFVKVPAHQDFSEKSKYFIAKINKLKNAVGLKDSDTLALYHQTWWENFISKNASKMKYAIPNNTLVALTKRWAFYDKSNKVIDIVKGISSPEFAEWVKTFDKEDHSKQIKQNMLPFETLFLELGAEVLSNASGFLAANPDEAVQSVRKKVDSAVKQLKGSKDLDKLDKLKIELQRIQALGGFDKIVPAEGLVFTYNGKTYKLTGAFAPVNQILGILKYGK